MILILTVLAVCLSCTAVSAAGAEPAEKLAVQVSVTGGKASVLTDGNENNYTTIPGGGSVTVTAEEGIASLYVIFDRIYGPWTLSDGAGSAPCGENGFLHEYIDVAEAFGRAPETVTLSFPEGNCSMAEIFSSMFLTRPGEQGIIETAGTAGRSGGRKINIERWKNIWMLPV